MKKAPARIPPGSIYKGDRPIMKNTVYELNVPAAAALKAAAECAGVDTNEIIAEEVTLDNGYYEVRFTSDWMEYDCYVDAATGEVPGLTALPLPAA